MLELKVSQDGRDWEVREQKGPGDEQIRAKTGIAQGRKWADVVVVQGLAWGSLPWLGFQSHA